MNNTSLWIYDFEVFKYGWCVTYKELDTQRYVVIVNDIQQLEDFTQTFKSDIFIGYNNEGYDKFIWDSILDEWNPYVVSNRIIQQKQQGWSFYKKFKYNLFQYDLLQHITQKPSLKMCEGNMGLEIKESDVPFDLDRPLTEEEWKSVLKYNQHDVNATEQLFYQTKETFMSHLLLINMFHLPLTALGKTFANLAAMILGAKKQNLWKNEISESVLDKDYYQAPKNLKLGQYKFIGEYFGSVIKDDFESRKVVIANTEHIIGLGGLHGASSQFYYESDEEYILLILDVTSYYPNLMILYDYLSRSVSDPTKYKEILDLRLQYKKDKVKELSEALKLVINITYGASGAQFNNLFDPRMRKSICVTGQLFLIDLIEKIEPYLEPNGLIQSNTDGIMLWIHRDYLTRLAIIVDEWEKRTGLNLEATVGQRIWQKDVNNYIFETIDQELKYKGLWTKDATLDMNSGIIINEALKEYFIHNTLPEDYIRQKHDLIKFQYITKSGATYKQEFQQIEGEFKPLDQRVNRVFATILPQYGCVYKQKPDKETYEKIANLPEHCLLINENIEGNVNHDIDNLLDYDFYIQQAWKRIEVFKGN